MNSSQITLQLTIDDGDPESTDAAQRMIQRDLIALHLETVEFSLQANEPPAASKSGPGVDIGTLILTLSGSAALPQIVALLNNWIRARSNRKVRLGIGKDVLELTGAS